MLLITLVVNNINISNMSNSTATMSNKRNSSLNALHIDHNCTAICNTSTSFLVKAAKYELLHYDYLRTISGAVN